MQTFRALGSRGVELESRARLFLHEQVAKAAIRVESSPRRQRELRNLRYALLTPEWSLGE